MLFGGIDSFVNLIYNVHVFMPFLWDFEGRLMGEADAQGVVKTEYLYHGRNLLAMVVIDILPFSVSSAPKGDAPRIKGSHCNIEEVEEPRSVREEGIFPMACSSGSSIQQ